MPKRNLRGHCGDVHGQMGDDAPAHRATGTKSLCWTRGTFRACKFIDAEHYATVTHPGVAFPTVHVRPYIMPGTVTKTLADTQELAQEALNHLEGEAATPMLLAIDMEHSFTPPLPPKRTAAAMENALPADGGAGTGAPAAAADDGRSLVQLAQGNLAAAFNLQAIHSNTPCFDLPQLFHMAGLPALTVLVFGHLEEAYVRCGGPLPVRFVDIQALYVKRCCDIQRGLEQPDDQLERFGYIRRKPSLAHVCEQVLGQPIDKSYQEGLWTTPPGFRDSEPGRFDAHIEYALLDSY
eukprot:1137050-Rhodomonas_salina.1